MKNGYWFLAQQSGIHPVGWGDLSLADLGAVAAHVQFDETFVVISERRRDDVWSASPEAEPARVNTDALVAHAIYAVATGTVWFVDHIGKANRRGVVWIRPGYRLTRTGGIIRAAPRRVMAITPSELHRRLTTNTKPWSTPSVSGTRPANDATCSTAETVGEPSATADQDRSCQHHGGCS